MNNKKLGNDFEKLMCQKLADRGYWAHFLSPDRSGKQPFDIIAASYGNTIVMDCKTLNDKAKKFPLSRLEDNQILAFEKWIACGNSQPIIAVYWHEQIYWIPYRILKEYGSIDMEDARIYVW